MIKYCLVVPVVFSLGVLFTPIVLLISTLPLLCFLLYQCARYIIHLFELMSWRRAQQDLGRSY